VLRAMIVSDVRDSQPERKTALNRADPQERTQIRVFCVSGNYGRFYIAGYIPRGYLLH